MLKNVIDRIYVAASTYDARFTRICVASLRCFYPESPIRLLSGGPLQSGLAVELQRYWGVQTTALPAGDYGWGFVKLEPLFGPVGERFLVLDSDTVLTGPVLDLWEDRDAPFLVDDEKQTEADSKSLYYDWEKLREIDHDARPPLFVFNSGQWFGTAGVLTRDDFTPWVEWTMPRRLRHPQYFMPGEQGVLNYVLNKKAALANLHVERRKLMRWPGHSLQGLDVASVANQAAEPLIVHWAGMKKPRLRVMVGGDLLMHYEKLYYSRMRGAKLRRIVANYQYFFFQLARLFRGRFELTYRKWFGSSLRKGVSSAE